MDDNNKVIAIGKRIKITKTQQHILLSVLAASLVVGVCMVLSVYFIKTIAFNAKVITAKDEAIVTYEKSIKNIGICQDVNGDGRYNNEELNNCDPNEIAAEDLPDTLRYNVLVQMANNTDLESVGRESQEECYDTSKKKIDFTKLYNKAETDDQRTYYLYMTRMCSALRVIPDALPAQQNTEALMASLNQIFLISDWVPESLSPSDTVPNVSIPGLEVIPLSLMVETNSEKTLEVLDNIEKSIRTFEIGSATISWSGADRLELRAAANSYYTNSLSVQEQTETVYANEEAAKKAAGGAI